MTVAMDHGARVKSRALQERAIKVLPGGVSRNTLLHDGPLHYADFGQGCRVTDIEGTERIDFANNVAAYIHGHAYGPIVSAVSKQLERGTGFTMATEVEIAFAEHMCGRAPGFERIRFVNSGSEAVMAGVKAMRALTGRPKIAKVEGAYHGAYDYVEVSQAPSPGNWGDAATPNPVPLSTGTPEGLLADTVILPFNDPEAAIAILDQHRDTIAGVIIDPLPHRVGLVPATHAFVSALRKWTRQNGALLMFDEVITFRTAVGGVQETLGVTPDLTSLGKMIGGGFPVGAIAGSAEAMSVFEKGAAGLRLPLSGTFSANPITMTAGLVAMQHFDRQAVTRLNALGDRARAGLAAAIHSADAPASVTGAGSLMRLHLKPKPPRNYREAYAGPAEKKALGALINAFYELGVMMIHTGTAALSTPMDEAEIDHLCGATCAALKLAKPLIEASAEEAEKRRG